MTNVRKEALFASLNQLLMGFGVGRVFFLLSLSVRSSYLSIQDRENTLVRRGRQKIWVAAKSAKLYTDSYIIYLSISLQEN